MGEWLQTCQTMDKEGLEICWGECSALVFLGPQLWFDGFTRCVRFLGSAPFLSMVEAIFCTLDTKKVSWCRLAYYPTEMWMESRLRIPTTPHCMTFHDRSRSAEVQKSSAIGNGSKKLTQQSFVERDSQGNISVSFWRGTVYKASLEMRSISISISCRREELDRREKLMHVGSLSAENDFGHRSSSNPAMGPWFFWESHNNYSLRKVTEQQKRKLKLIKEVQLVLAWGHSKIEDCGFW